MAKNFCFSFAVCVVLLLPFEGVALTTAESVTAKHYLLDNSRGTSEVVRTVSDGTFTETLRGNAALSHLRNLQRKRSREFAEAERALHERGFVKTDTVVVVRSRALTRYPDRRPSSVWEVQTYTSPEAELVFWSWTDGDPATWEGSIYMCAYGHGEILSDAQFDIRSLETADVIWEDVIAWDREGPDHQEARQAGVQLASLGSRDGQQAFPYVEDVPPESPNKKWLKCTLMACGAAALVCWWTGEAFMICFMPACAMGAFLCTLQVILDAW